MTSETDSSSSTSSSTEKKLKLSKKLKKKSEKKSKKHKKEKKSRKEKKRPRKVTSSSKVDNIQIQKPKARPEENVNINEETDAFGPALPPHLLNRSNNVEKDQSVIGPVIPQDLLQNLQQSETTNLSGKSSPKYLNRTSKTESEEECLQGSYGPLPTTIESEMTPVQIELEQRALELKMAAIDGITTSSSDTNVREKWMLELPEVGLKGGLAALKNMKRGFHQGKEKPDFSDRSSWTKTPQTANERQSSTSSKELELQAQVLYEKQRDAEQEAIAKKHKKKHKRDESLVELHQKKLRKEERKKAKELKESGNKPERRPFTRDVDLKLNKIDRNQTRQIVDKAKILNTKFSSGQSKYL